VIVSHKNASHSIAMERLSAVEASKIENLHLLVGKSLGRCSGEDIADQHLSLLGYDHMVMSTLVSKDGSLHTDIFGGSMKSPYFQNTS